MLNRIQIRRETKKGLEINPRYRCQYCGNKLLYNITKLGFSILCPMCKVLTVSYQTREQALKGGLAIGKIFDLDRFTGNRVQMSSMRHDD